MPTKCCDNQGDPGNGNFELIRIAKSKFACGVCEQYTERQKTKPFAVIACEGACLRGEVARRAANVLCHALDREHAVRICLGGAFTKDGGQRALVRNAAGVVALEGCSLDCASRMMAGVVEGLHAQVIRTDELFDFDQSLFGIDEMSETEYSTHARTVAEKAAELMAQEGSTR